MSEEKPLHVQVAEALGWTEIALCGGNDFHGRCRTDLKGRRDHSHGGGLYWIPRYDTDWSATGPLIERYGITLESPENPTAAMMGSDGRWQASWNTACPYPHYADETTQAEAIDTPCHCHDDVVGKTPLEAVCHLILALHEAGKLKAAW